ncbi:MAG: type II toxin-antitoxin system RelE/ParE family toxin [Hyphomicrobiales bacterium]|nr:type II toxin-antitoxin system RelE/ParE family toxin [Hyphomicrobiales bacterium]MBV9974250.1 type II toxin-antitoxin system RelE/ParE family toxin [Hyphomicrobiales bacterium]
MIDHPYLGQPSATTIGIHELRVARLPYVLPYRVVNERIEILRVFHESQDRPSAWQSE